ncbi:hypothetical protein BKA69DRAFT_624160 [Paraphysoderma sedebokerense]|nr:hypothetical protein BKA69DRAFT_624160 [Paraphysoderma sedebokerense]
MIPSTSTNINHNDKGRNNNPSFPTSSSSALPSTSASTSTQPSCPACHSLSLQFTPSISATVCTNCGNIIDEDTLCTQDVHIDDKGRECRERIGSEFQKVRQWGREKWVGFCMREIKRFLTLLCNSLNLSQVVKAQAFELFKNAKRLNPKFQFGDRGKIMVAGCLYIVVRNDGKPVSLLEIAVCAQSSSNQIVKFQNGLTSTV